MCSSFRKLLDMNRLSKYKSEKVESGNGAIFGGHHACFRPWIHPESVTKALSITSGHSRAWKQNLIREFRCELREPGRSRERRGGKRIVGEFEKRCALTSFVFTFYGRQSKGGRLFPGCFHDCLSPPVLMLPVFERANRVNADTARAVYTRVLLNFDRGESVLTSIESASEMHAPTNTGRDGEMAPFEFL